MLDLKNKILLERLYRRDQAAFAEVYDLYVDEIYRFIYYKVGNSKEEAEDLTSSVFLKTWNHLLENKRKGDSLRPLLYKIARNTVIDHYRKKAVETREMLEAGQTLDSAGDERRELLAVEAKEDWRLISERLGELKDEYREVIMMRFIEELSISEIAAALDKTRGNVRVTIYRALKALRELLAEKIS